MGETFIANLINPNHIDPLRFLQTGVLPSILAALLFFHLSIVGDWVGKRIKGKRLEPLKKADSDSQGRG